MVKMHVVIRFVWAGKITLCFCDSMGWCVLRVWEAVRLRFIIQNLGGKAVCPPPIIN